MKFDLRRDGFLGVNERADLYLCDFLYRQAERIEDFQTDKVVLHHVQSIGKEEDESFFLIIPMINPINARIALFSIT